MPPAPPLLLGGRLSGVARVEGLETGRGVLSLAGMPPDWRRDRKRGLPSALVPDWRRKRVGGGEADSMWPRSWLYGLFMGPLAVMMLCIRAIFCRVSCSTTQKGYK